MGLMTLIHWTRQRLPRDKMWRNSQSLFCSYGKVVNWLTITLHHVAR